MKKIKFLPVIAILAFLISCSSSNKPETVAEKFCLKLYTADFEAAKEFCTEESRQTVDFVAAFASGKVTDMKNADIKFELKEVEMAEDGNSAIVKAIIKGAIDLKDGDIKESTDTKLHMVKENDQWLVQFKLK